MQQPTKKHRSMAAILLALATFGLAAAYLAVVFTSHDFLWFQTGFSDIPSRVVVYQAGQRSEFQDGQSGYQELANAIQASLNQGIVAPSGLDLSQQSLDDAYFKDVTVEAFFDRPVKLHAWFDTGEPTQMLFPITGNKAGQAAVFMGLNGVYLSNAPKLNTITPLLDALRKLGFEIG
jgi:hypothetical protein